MVEDAADQDRRVKGMGLLARVTEGGTCGVVGLVVKEGRGVTVGGKAGCGGS